MQLKQDKWEIKMKVLRAIFDYEVSGHGQTYTGKDAVAAFVPHNSTKAFDEARQAAVAKIMKSWEHDGVTAKDITVYNLRVGV